MAEKKSRRALGRGLEALLPTKTTAKSPSYGARAVFRCAIERIHPRRDQPRRHFAPAALEELAQTIREHGIIQPIVVRRLAGDDDRFEIIAGERRWRAAQKAGLKDVPVVVKDVSPDAAFELALIENVQRQDLNPLEIAEAYQRLLNDHGNTQEQLAGRVGKSRSAVTNSLRLLKLPDSVRMLIRDGILSEGHGRALLGAADVSTMQRVARKAAAGRLSVRKVEKLVRTSKREKKEPAAAGATGKSAGVRDLERRLSLKLGARTVVEHNGPGGKVTIRYADLDELDRIIDVIDA